MRQKSSTASKGSVTLAVLVLLLLVSLLVVSMVFVTNTETQLAHTDVENTAAYYGAEAGMEKMMSDLNDLYTSQQAPSVPIITALGDSSFQPALPGVTYPQFSYSVQDDNADDVPDSEVRTISSGANEGLIAQIVPITLDVEAQRPSGAEVKMRREVEVALIPVFQFGMFSDTDLSYFPGPNFDFAGRVHTNGNLFLATSNAAGLKFHSKITAVGEVIRRELSNGEPTDPPRDQPVMIPQAPAGCDGAAPACRDLQENEGSKVLGPSSADNMGWPNISTSTYNGMILNGDTGARPLTLPFVADGLRNIDLIRRPPAAEDPLSASGASRLYAHAQIRVILADTLAELPGGAADPQNVRLDNVGPYAAGVPVPGFNPSYFAVATRNAADGANVDANWVQQPDAVAQRWPLLNGFLRVETRRANGAFLPVTQEWLNLGFARGIVPAQPAALRFPSPDAEHGIANSVHPDAILIFQVKSDRNDDGDIGDAGESAVVAAVCPGGTAAEQTACRNAQYSWSPINMYDTREGEIRDTTATTNCAIGGVMNVVELDVRNLTRWLSGAIGVTGTLTENVIENGYLLYFSDRRGMLPNGAGDMTGEYGYEDIINPGTTTDNPNGALDAAEDVNDNAALDVFGRANLGDAFFPAVQGGDFNTDPGASNINPSDRADTRVNCLLTARRNRVSGARHGLKLVNGSLLNGVQGPPRRPDGTGGFSVAAENPVYVQGNYNSSSAGGFANPHAAAAVMADTVTLLSWNWRDAFSFRAPVTPANRAAVTSYYRMAVAAGKNKSFPYPGFDDDDFGTDGGTHNFLRYLEHWGGDTLFYRGSLVSLYHSEYGIGIYKCCTKVYSPPTRNYSFDTEFLDPSRLPPGTPRFRDVVNLGYRQIF